MFVILAVSFAAAVALLLWVAHKVRRVHLSTYELLTEARAARQEVQTLYAQLQAADGLKQLLHLETPLPALRGWAGSPDFLLEVARHMKRHRPESVLECSSGSSTLVIARCLQQQGRGHVWSLEHEPAFAAKTRQLLEEHGVADWATVLEAPLEPQADGSLWYRTDAIPAGIPPVGLLVVDGPPESSGPMARAPAFTKLRRLLAPGACIFVDDADRPAETAMVRTWQAGEPGLTVEQRVAEKGLAVVTLPN